MASSATRGARSARIRPSLRHSPAAVDRATSWNTTATPPAGGPSPSRMPPCSSSQRPTVRDSGSTGSPAPAAPPTPYACGPPAASAPYSRSAAPPPTTTITSGPAAASPATARAAAAATLRSSSGGSLAAEPSASGISRGGCGQTAPAISMASVCLSYAHGGHPGARRARSGRQPCLSTRAIPGSLCQVGSGGWLTDGGHAEQHRWRCPGSTARGGRHGQAVLAGLPRVPAQGPPHRERRFVRDQVVRRRLGHHRGHHGGAAPPDRGRRTEEHTSELQSRFELVCRLLLEKKNKTH